MPRRASSPATIRIPLPRESPELPANGAGSQAVSDDPEEQAWRAWRSARNDWDSPAPEESRIRGLTRCIGIGATALDAICNRTARSWRATVAFSFACAALTWGVGTFVGAVNGKAGAEGKPPAIDAYGHTDAAIPNAVRQRAAGVVRVSNIQGIQVAGIKVEPNRYIASDGALMASPEEETICSGTIVDHGAGVSTAVSHAVRPVAVSRGSNLAIFSTGDPAFTANTPITPLATTPAYGRPKESSFIVSPGTTEAPGRTLPVVIVGGGGPTAYAVTGPEGQDTIPPAGAIAFDSTGRAEGIVRGSESRGVAQVEETFGIDIAGNAGGQVSLIAMSVLTDYQTQHLLNGGANPTGC